MASEVPECPEDCEYRKSFGGHWPYCDYLLMADHMRGCEPGPGCKRYMRRSRHKAPTWDVEKGRKLWEQGYTDGQISKILGVRRGTVAGYRERNWGEINRQRQKRK